MIWRINGQLLPFLVIIVALLADKDPYKVLEVPRSASATDIKQAYKKLAKQYHPDKNRGSPDEEKVAHEKFLEIGKAYEILSDDDRKSNYDRYGDTGERKSGNQGGGGGQYGFDHWSFHYQQQQQRHTQYYSSPAFSDSIATKLTTDNYDYVVNGEGSDRNQVRVWLILAYADHCTQCERVKDPFERVAKALKGMIRTGKIHTDYENGLARKLGITQIPLIFAVRTHKGSQVREVVPYSKMSSDVLLTDFLGTMMDKHCPITMLSRSRSPVSEVRQRMDAFTAKFGDRVRGVIISDSGVPKLAFRFVAEELREVAAWAYLCPSCLPAESVLLEKLFPHGDTARRVQERRENRASASYSGSSGVIVVLQRESGVRDDVLTVDADTLSSASSLRELLQPLLQLGLPRLSSENFYDLCLKRRPTSGGSSSAGGGAGAAGAAGSKRKIVEEAKGVWCLIFFAGSETQARESALPALLDPDCPSTMHTTSGQEQEAAASSTAASSSSQQQPMRSVWLHHRSQPQLTRFLLSASSPSSTVTIKEKKGGEKPCSDPTHCVALLDARKSKVTMLDCGAVCRPHHVISWIKDAQGGKLTWDDGESRGGVPYPEDEWGILSRLSNTLMMSSPPVLSSVIAGLSEGLSTARSTLETVAGTTDILSLLFALIFCLLSFFLLPRVINP